MGLQRLQGCRAWIYFHFIFLSDGLKWRKWPDVPWLFFDNELVVYPSVLFRVVFYSGIFVIRTNPIVFFRQPKCMWWNTGTGFRNSENKANRKLCAQYSTNIQISNRNRGDLDATRFAPLQECFKYLLQLKKMTKYTNGDEKVEFCCLRKLLRHSEHEQNL
jgi:hypothetical protein